MFKENVLSVFIIFVEGMNDIKFIIKIGKLYNKFLFFNMLKIVLRLKLFKKFISFNFNMIKSIKVCIIF